ncbi:LPIN3 phosphatase, partial [Upupa epops]|nr:LPIN3 phosphatase [Upupa epops]
MNYVGQLAETVFVTVRELYQGLNPSTLTGCVDVVVVRQPDNSFQCSPFHVCFGKLGVLRSEEKVVDIEVNGKPVDLHMELGDDGEAFFVQELEENEGTIPSCLCTSPITREQSLEGAAPSSDGQEVSSTEAMLREKWHCRRKPKQKEPLDSEGCEETTSGMSVEFLHRLPALRWGGWRAAKVTSFLLCSDPVDFSFADQPEAAAGSLHPPETSPYSNGELASVDSPILSHPSSPKSDSELDIKQQESLGAESQVQWNWGRLPRVNRSSKTTAAAASVMLIPGNETTPLDATSEGLGAGPSSSWNAAAALCSAGGDETEQSAKSVSDPSNPAGAQLPASLPATSPKDSNWDSLPAIALSLCGGLGNNRQLSQEKFKEHMVSYQQFAENPGLIDHPDLVILINRKFYSWAVAAPMLLSLQAFQRNIPESAINQLVKEKMPKKGSRWWFSWRRRELLAELLQSCARWREANTLFPVYRQEEEGPSSDDDVLVMGNPAQTSLPACKKSLRLSSRQIERLNLQDGPNEVVFSVTTQYQGTCRCQATIYLWNWDDRVVISDIEGTITKSDALGPILPHRGRDCTHHGVAKLFHRIHLNGYKFLYCSARAVSMACVTKGHPRGVNKQGCSLPRGPILLAPSSLFSAFHREVAERKPEEFKISCLMDLQNLFPMQSPFYAAFGSRASDVCAYKQVGLSESHIFMVNPKGELIQELTKIHKATYEELSELVELVFPPL